MKKLIVLNRSLGELEWIIANYDLIITNADKVKILCYRVDKDSVMKFAPNFFKDSDIEILSVENLVKRFRLLKRVDSFLDKTSTYLFNKFGSNFQYKYDRNIIFLKKIISYLFRLAPEYFKDVGVVYHENNDRTTSLLELIKRKSKHESLVFFPHHFGATQPVNSLTLKIHKEIGVDTCYVNFEMESGIGDYEYLGQSLVNKNELNDSDLKVLILTRQCSDSFGFSYESAYQNLDILISKLKLYDVEIYIKNHPRDSNNYHWNLLVNKYDLTVIEHSAIDFVKKNKAVCFHLHTTLCIPLSKLNISCYDVSPYEASLVEKNESLQYQIKIQSQFNSTLLVDDLKTFNLERVFK